VLGQNSADVVRDRLKDDAGDLARVVPERCLDGCRGPLNRHTTVFSTASRNIPAEPGSIVSQLRAR